VDPRVDALAEQMGPAAPVRDIRLHDHAGNFLGVQPPARGIAVLYRRSRVLALLRRELNRAAWEARQQTAFRNHFLGVPLLKLPTDLWNYQELLSELRPNLVVETGTYRGGSALYLASICDLLGNGRVITVDAERWGEPPEHPRVEHLIGSSVSGDVRQRVERAAAGCERVLVILDSDHRREHVLAELRAYADLVTAGSYVVVEDTNINGHPVEPGWGPGPMEAVEAFLAEDSRFAPDPERERHFLTSNPRGYLRRVR
jgi:cephalosporin hydroxylase